ncbi:hypothetical protein V2S66_28425 [Streptomyces sp. V4-01]|uniref:Uncharacterized protein n=1 Tax=Actinacidiphila polyblastidii TaxID=3110430 RepID=A0ABU7PJ80_9ACTN|nr:hypothetical protein [Streptomyces sp. V4-01]
MIAIGTDDDLHGRRADHGGRLDEDSLPLRFRGGLMPAAAGPPAATAARPAPGRRAYVRLPLVPARLDR